MKRRFVLCQVSNRFLNPDAGKSSDLMNSCYDSLYVNKACDGYWRPRHFWELPKWIGEMTYVLVEQPGWDTEISLHIVEDDSYILPEFYDSVPTFYCFSVMDVNRDIVCDIISANPDEKFCLGGYVKPYGVSACLPSVRWFDSIQDLCLCFDYDYSYGTNWTLFSGERTIPRLTLSTGCSNMCSFCTVPKEVIGLRLHDIAVQVKALRSLQFKLVYLDDKTYGQAASFSLLEHLYTEIKAFNQDFKGFIVQTTAAMVGSHPERFDDKYHIFAVELGVETFNDKLLTRYKKPARVVSINGAMEILEDKCIEVIVNLILGLPGETYETYLNTLSFLITNTDRIYALNVNTLALYEDCKLFEEFGTVGVTPQSDKDQLGTDRTFWTKEETELYEQFSKCIYASGIIIHRRK
jgi:hypothetical protein